MRKVVEGAVEAASHIMLSRVIDDASDDPQCLTDDCILLLCICEEENTGSSEDSGFTGTLPDKCFEELSLCGR